VKKYKGILDHQLPVGEYNEILSDSKMKVDKQISVPSHSFIFEFSGSIKLKKLYSELLDYKGY